ncbi:MAG: TIGR02449 family protein [Methylococcales bacterium]|nr:MAG: TIGR02449 family protein [Methylococcales bacterium]
MTEIYLTPEYINLEDRLDQLIDKYTDLKRDNARLKIKYDTLAQEKEVLLEKTSLVQAKLDSMINRLQALENGL